MKDLCKTIVLGFPMYLLLALYLKPETPSAHFVTGIIAGACTAGIWGALSRES